MMHSSIVLLRAMRSPLLRRFERACRVIPEDPSHSLHFLGRHVDRQQMEKVLSAGAVEIDFTAQVKRGWLDGCDCFPIKKLYSNQLAANSPFEDRWNVGLTQVLAIFFH